MPSDLADIKPIACHLFSGQGPIAIGVRKYPPCLGVLRESGNKIVLGSFFGRVCDHSSLCEYLMCGRLIAWLIEIKVSISLARRRLMRCHILGSGECRSLPFRIFYSFSIPDSGLPVKRLFMDNAVPQDIFVGGGRLVTFGAFAGIGHFAPLVDSILVSVRG